MKKIHIPLATVILILLFSLVSCAKKDANYFLQQARLASESGKTEEAILQYKSAISLEPQNPLLRKELGLIYATTGNLQSALKEMELAANSGPLDGELFYKIIEAHFLLESDLQISNFYAEHKDSFNGADVTHATMLATVANKRLGDEKAALALISTLEASHPVLFKGLSAYVSDDYVTAFKHLKENEALIKEQIGTSLVLAQIASAVEEHEYSLALYQIVSEAIPNFLPFQLFLANNLILLEQYDAARPIVKTLLAGYPEHAYLNYLHSVLLIKNNDIEGAKIAAEKAINNGFNTAQARSIAGIANYFMGNFESAYQNLKFVESSGENNGFIYGIYIAASLELGYGSSTYDPLVKAQSSEQTDKLSAYFAQQLVAHGDQNLINKLIVERFESDDAEINNQTAVAAIVLNRKDMWEKLESYVTAHLEDNYLSSLFIAQQIRNKQFDVALRVAQKWHAHSPDLLTTRQTLAATLLLTGNNDQAQAAAQKTLEAFPQDISSIFLIKKVQTMEADYAESKHLLSQVFAIDPAHGDSLKLLRDKITNIDEIRDFTDYLNQIAQQENGKSDYVIDSLNELELSLGQQQKVINRLLVVPIEKMDEQQAVTLAKAYVQDQQNAKAIELLKQKLAMAPGSSRLFVTLLSIQAINKDFADIFNNIDKRMRLASNDTELKILKADYQVAAGEISAALLTLQNLADLNPTQKAMTEMLEGKIAYMEKRYADAVPGLIKLYIAQKDTASLSMLFWSYLKSEQKDQAYTVLNNHVKALPGDINSLSFAAELNTGKDNQLAIQNYLALYRFNPRNPITINNLSFVYRLSGDIDNAIKYSAKALELAPNNPSIMDTHGVNLLIKGDNKSAETILSEAYAISRNESIGINYVQALITNKKNGEAKKILGTLVAKNDIQQKQIDFFKTHLNEQKI